jgi:16S rRNA (guanine527-N7)-methyltransferase
MANAGQTPGQAASDGLAADKRAALALVAVSRETEARLDRYVALLLEWQAKTNLVAPSTLSSIWSRHIVDSLQLLDIAPTGRTWIDLGSGGGFPGIVLAAALAGLPGAHVHLVERNAKKAAFLREALRVTGGQGTVHLAEIEKFVDSNPPKADYITARALAPLNVLLGLSAPLIDRGAKALFLKGQDVEAELTEATKYWTVEVRLHPSRTNMESRVVEVDQLFAKGAPATVRRGKRS